MIRNVDRSREGEPRRTSTEPTRAATFALMRGWIIMAAGVVAFYLAGNPARTGSYAVDTGSMVSEYGLLSLITGFAMAAVARAIASRVAVAPWRWTVACCSFLTLAVIVSWLVLGWGAQDVTTASGVVTTGTSTFDVVMSSAIVLAFSYGVIVFAVVGMPESRSRQRSPR